MNRNDRDIILGYIFNSPEIPEDIKRRFENWVIGNETDSEMDEAMWRIWCDLEAQHSEEADRKGLARLKKSIRRKRSHTVLRRVMGCAAAIAVFAAIFAGGWWSASRTVEPLREITLLTAEGHIGEFVLPDGTKVWLNENSRLSYNDGLTGDTRDVKLTGEAFFEVSKDAARPFRVAMNEFQVEVLGTSFDAINYPSSREESIILKNGSVKVSGDHVGTGLTMHPGDKLSIDRFTEKISMEEVEALNWCQWFSTKIQFDNTPLTDIITNLERRYNIEIYLSSSIPSDRRLSMSICQEPLEDIMEVLSLLLSTRYKIDGDKVWITK